MNLNAEIYLYRLKLIRPLQQSLLHENLTRDQILNIAIDEKPLSDSRPGVYWHLGNIERIDPNIGSLAFGKTSKRKKDVFDFDKREFIQEGDINSPFTKIYFNAKLGIIGIVKKSKVAPVVNDIARKFAKLLQGTSVIRRNEIIIHLDEIKDPTNFIAELSEAERIYKFTFTFTKPNPEDIDIELQKPLEKYAELANAESGKTEIDGKNLSSPTLVKVSRSVASTGNDAEAKILKKGSKKPIKTRMRGNPARVTAVYGEDIESVSGKFYGEYSRIRGPNEVV